MVTRLQRAPSIEGICPVLLCFDLFYLKTLFLIENGK